MDQPRVLRSVRRNNPDMILLDGLFPGLTSGHRKDNGSRKSKQFVVPGSTRPTTNSAKEDAGGCKRGRGRPRKAVLGVLGLTSGHGKDKRSKRFVVPASIKPSTHSVTEDVGGRNGDRVQHRVLRSVRRNNPDIKLLDGLFPDLALSHSGKDNRIRRSEPFAVPASARPSTNSFTVGVGGRNGDRVQPRVLRSVKRNNPDIKLLDGLVPALASGHNGKDHRIKKSKPFVPESASTRLETNSVTEDAGAGGRKRDQVQPRVLRSVKRNNPDLKLLDGLFPDLTSGHGKDNRIRRNKIFLPASTRQTMNSAKEDAGGYKRGRGRPRKAVLCNSNTTTSSGASSTPTLKKTILPILNNKLPSPGPLTNPVKTLVPVSTAVNELTLYRQFPYPALDEELNTGSRQKIVLIYSKRGPTTASKKLYFAPQVAKRLEEANQLSTSTRFPSSFIF